MSKVEVFGNIISNALLNQKQINITVNKISKGSENSLVYWSFLYDPYRCGLEGDIISIKNEDYIDYISLEDVIKITVAK